MAVNIVLEILWNVKVRNKIFSKLEVSNMVFHLLVSSQRNLRTFFKPLLLQAYNLQISVGIEKHISC